jgi:hypothetical protein
MKVLFILISIILINLALNDNTDLTSGVAISKKMYKNNNYNFYIKASHEQNVIVDLSMTYVDKNPFSDSKIYELYDKTSSLSSSHSLSLSSSKEGSILKMNGNYNVFDLVAHYAAIQLIPNYDMDLTIKVTVEDSETKQIVSTTFQMIMYGLIALIVLCIIITTLCLICHCYCNKHANPNPRPVPQNMTPLQPQAAQPQYYPPQQNTSGKLYP